VLQSIDEPHKSTFVLRYFDELSLKEISEIHQCSEGTVKSRLFYTLRKIAARLPQFQHLTT
jgi:RNA polymerase sigma-70 factor (ECF subfamily)